MYVNRQQEESQVRRLLASREPIAIVGPWQVGKSAFFEHVLRVLIRENDRREGTDSTIISIHVPDLVAGCTDDGQFLRRVVHEIGGEALLGLERRLPPDLSKPGRLRLLMRDELRRKGRIVLAFEDAGALASLDDSTREWFVSCLKMWGEWGRFHEGTLQILMELSTSLEPLNRDITVSPWNVTPVHLGELDVAQVAALSRAYSLDWTEPRISRWLSPDFGGYPALLRAIMESARANGRPIESFALGDPPNLVPEHPARPMLDSMFARISRDPTLLNVANNVVAHGGDLVLERHDALALSVQRLLGTGLIKRLDRGAEGQRNSESRPFSFGCRAYEAYLRERLHSRVTET